MSSELEVLKQRIIELEAENAEIPELRKKLAEIPELRKKLAEVEARNVEIEARNAELMKQMIVENNRRDARIEDTNDRVTKLEQKQLQNDDTPNNNLSNFNSGAEHHEEPLEDKGMDDFLNEVDKKIIGDEIRRHNKEKKLQRESADQDSTTDAAYVPETVNDIDVLKITNCTTSELSSSSHETEVIEDIANSAVDSNTINDRSASENSEKNGNSVTNRDDRQKNIPVINMSQGNDDDDTEFTKSQNIEQELIKELLSSIIAPSISSEATEPIPLVTHLSSSLDTTQNLVHLFQNTIRAGHEVILSWLYYSISFENKVDEIRHDTGASDKTARSQIYNEMLEHLPDITLGNLRMRTLRAKKIRMLFGEGGVGIDKIKQVTFSAYDISSLTINQIQSVIKNVTSAERTPEVPNTNHVSSVTIRDDQINAPLISAEVSRPPIPRTNPTYDWAYSRNKILDQYPNLYRECSSEDFDYYGINDETLCPLCKLDHDDEEGIDGMYKSGSYFIKCEQREIEITA
ncbi:hypothetical protein C1646_445593 [Rhizophagus diaphanus]|nr:hypothetical protein C1646_445593 [Rhizophagus diaphanus] [Rhizophagus sp. MUCL 43196]